MSKRVQRRSGRMVIRSSATKKGTSTSHVPKPIRQATTKFIKKYRTTLRDLEKF